MTADTFATVDDALATVAQIRRERVAVPIDGLALLRELADIREAAQASWAKRSAMLADVLAKAEAEAEGEVATFKGLSHAARVAHIEERTADARQATRAENPTPESFVHWSPQTITRCVATLEAELQAGIGRLLG